MKGKPKFKYGDSVLFKIKEQTKFGTIYIIDAYGTWDDPSDVSYDIMVPDDKHKVTIWDPLTHEKNIEERVGDCLYKHIREDYVESV